MFPRSGVAPSAGSATVLRHGTYCGCCGGPCCGQAAQKPGQINVVAVLRFHGEGWQSTSPFDQNCAKDTFLTP
jgi:hypothetical protein